MSVALAKDIKKVLMVEDHPLTQQMWKHRMPPSVAVVQAFTLAEAEELFLKNSNIDVIVMDFSLPDGNTQKLVLKIRKTFHGPMIAASIDERSRKILLESGCSHSTLIKYNVPDLVMELLAN